VSHDTMTAEAQALHAVLADDLDDAARILGGFLPGELRALQRACGLLAALCVDVRRDPPQTAAGAARTQRTFTSPSQTSEGGVDVAPPELGEDPSN
jgi:hypothetical protein